jgi:hypothetical protein
MELLHWNRHRRSIRGCGHRHLQPHCHRWCIVHIIVKIIVINIFYSIFNNVDLLRSMSADCCMPWRQEWGTMAAVGGRRLPWLACVCILPSFRWVFPRYICVRCLPTQYLTNNQPPSHLNNSINNRWMRTFYGAILCTCIVGRRLCSMVALFLYLGVDGSRQSSRNDGKLANKSVDPP